MRKALTALALAAAFAVFVGPAVAQAQEYPPSGEDLTVSDSRVVRGDAIGVRRDDRGDLEREGPRVGARPERRAAAGVLDREREGQPAVRERGGVEPVAELDGLRCGDGGDVGEHLEGVPRRGGLALGRAQVGLQTVAVAAVRVAVGAEGGEDEPGVGAVEEQLEASPVKQAGVAGQEAARTGDHLARGPALPAILRFGHARQPRIAPRSASGGRVPSR